MRTTNHNQILNYFKQLATEHTLIQGRFYRYNWGEVTGALRHKEDGFICLMESHSGAIEQQERGTSPMNKRTVSLLFLDSAAPGDYEKQNQILDTSEQILLDFVARIKHDASNLRHDSPLKWLKGFNPSSAAYDNGGPLFVNHYGYNLIIELPGTADICYDPDTAARFGVEPDED